MVYIKLFENYFWTEPKFWVDKTPYDRIKQCMDYIIPKIKKGSDFEVLNIHKGTDESSYSKAGKDDSYVLFKLGGNEYILKANLAATTYNFIIHLKKKENDNLLKLMDGMYGGTPDEFIKIINSF